MVGVNVRTKVCYRRGCGLNYVPMYAGDPMCEFCHHEEQEKARRQAQAQTEEEKPRASYRSSKTAEWKAAHADEVRRKAKAYWAREGRHRRAERKAIADATVRMAETGDDRAWVFRYVGPASKAHALAFYSLTAMVIPAGYKVVGIVDKAGVLTPAKEMKGSEA